MPTGVYPRPSLEERFLSKISFTEGCWEWAAALDGQGYSQISRAGRPVKGYRVAYELLVGPIPDGLVLDHLCMNRGCVRPSHLEPVTHAENIRRGYAAKPRAQKSCCKRGHPYSGENTMNRSNGTRECRTCISRRGK